MDEYLVGYLLKALDDDTQRAVEAHVHTDAEAARHLELLRQALKPLAADAIASEPPPGLWVRTLARVGEQRARELPRAPAILPLESPAVNRAWWRRSDALVAAAILLGLLSLVPPGVVKLHQTRDRLHCENNLRLFHQALSAYGDLHGNDFPKIDTRPPLYFAGSFVPQLHEAGVLGSDVSMRCAAGDRQLPGRFTRRELQEMRQTNRAAFERLVKEMAGCYAYTLGYRDAEGNLHGLRREPGSDLAPILADSPPFVPPASPSEEVNSPNHGGAGQNVLHIGGNVRFCTQRRVGPNLDDIYLNQNHQVAAGLNANDTVLGASAAQPGPVGPNNE
jgi:hypothetical protein